MADEGNQQQQRQQGEGQQAAGDSQKQGEGRQQQQQPAADEGNVTDKHGQPGINKERHDREMAEKDQKIAELQAQLEEASKTEEGRAKLQKELDEAKASLADMGVTHSLELAGCINVKAAKALLEDYDGDVAKLKEACPYLFGKEKQTGSTGKKPEGGQQSALDEKLDRAFGLKK